METKTEIKLWCVSLILIVINVLFLAYNVRESQKVYNIPFIPNTLPISQNRPIKEYVDWSAKQAGLSPDYVFNLIECESQWNGKVVSYTDDYGLWQINSIYRLTIEQMLNPYFSTKWSIKKRLNDGNWNAWSCSKIIK